MTEPAKSPGHVSLPVALVGGVLGGVAGTLAFGALLRAFDTGFVRTFIPTLYGVPQSGLVGWAIHVLNGAILGLLFGALVTRKPARSQLVPDVDEPQLGPSGPGIRTVAAGLVFGLAIWAILPMLALPLYLGIADEPAVQAVPASQLQSLAAHVVFGVVLGAVYAAVTRLANGRDGDDQ